MIYGFQFSFDLTYTVVGAVVFIYVLLDDLLVISFVAGLYFKMEKFVKTLTKYSWARRVCQICIDLLLVGYHLISLSPLDNMIPGGLLPPPPGHELLRPRHGAPPGPLPRLRPG